VFSDDAGRIAKVLLHGDEVRKGGQPMIVRAIKEGLIRGIVLALYALIGYLFAYIAMGGKVL